MFNFPVKFGLKDDDLVFIGDVKAGLDCGCVCSYCESELVAKNQGKKKTHHFAHKSGSECSYGVETGLHKFAKRIIQERGEIQLPDLDIQIPGHNIVLLPSNRLIADKVTLEDGEVNFIPDVTIYSGDKKYFVEIVVTSSVDEVKVEKIIKRGCSTLIIDLHDMPYCFDPELLEEIIIDGLERKSWIFHADENALYDAERPRISRILEAQRMRERAIRRREREEEKTFWKNLSEEWDEDFKARREITLKKKRERLRLHQEKKSQRNKENPE